MKKALPIGVDNFEEIIQEGYCYVDKTLMIRELLDLKGKVNLFTRPRRFGKTLAMSMLEHFFLWNMQIRVPYLKDSTYGKKRSTTASRAAIR